MSDVNAVGMQNDVYRGVPYRVFVLSAHFSRKALHILSRQTLYLFTYKGNSQGLRSRLVEVEACVFILW